MSDTALRKVVGRAINNEAFRQVLFSSPQEALSAYVLSNDARQLLENLNENDLDQFAGGLGNASRQGRG